MTEREALKLALEALEKFRYHIANNYEINAAIVAAREALAQPEQEPVAWPCVIAEADFSENIITLTMQCTDYKVSAGKHWLSTIPPQRTWVGLNAGEVYDLYDSDYKVFHQRIEDKLKDKNGYDS